MFCFTLCMEVCSANNNVYFTAKSPKIREAERFCRIITSEFPAASGTKVNESKYAQKPKFKKIIDKINETITDKIREPFWACSDKTEGILGFIRNIKDFHIANCADFAKLCSIICHTNGIEVTQPRIFAGSAGNELGKLVDHAILMVKPKKNFICKKMSDLKDVIIIDPWLGFADFANNVEQRFMSEYSSFFKFPEGTKLRIINMSDDSGIKMTPEMIDAVKEQYPQFVVKKS